MVKKLLRSKDCCITPCNDLKLREKLNDAVSKIQQINISYPQ